MFGGRFFLLVGHSSVRGAVFAVLLRPRDVTLPMQRYCHCHELAANSLKRQCGGIAFQSRVGLAFVVRPDPGVAEKPTIIESPVLDHLGQSVIIDLIKYYVGQQIGRQLD